MVAVMGPSGSGKSTLLHCLAGVLVPDGGQVWFDGCRVDGMPDAERSALRRHSFAFVFQFGQLIPELPAVENVALPLLLDGTGRRAALAAARDASEDVGRIVPRENVLVPTDGAGRTLDQIRTVAAPWVLGDSVVSELESSRATDRKISHVSRALTLAMLATLVVAGCSVAVAAVGGLLERRIPFALLRLSGAPLRTLRAVVMRGSGVAAVHPGDDQRHARPGGVMDHRPLQP
jgi:ABC-type sugar transport system ATPase subunit